MNISHKIEQCLASEFHAKFSVRKENSANEEYIIKIGESNDMYFYLDVIIKDDIRLTILCEPEKYGAGFVGVLNEASIEQRILFCDYWKQLGKKALAVKINENQVDFQWIQESNVAWNRFALKYTKAPFCDENGARDEIIIETVKNVLSMVLALTNYSVEGDCECGYEEGAAQKIVLTKYERNPINRRLCLMMKGYKCSVCGFDFAEKYGDIGKGYIEVHHAIPVSTMDKNHVVDVEKELFPVCSNCHSMIHRRKIPFSIKEIQERIKND